VFFRRRAAGEDPWLVAKMWIFAIGAGLALAGMATEIRWLIGAAAVVLVAGIAIRFVPRGGDPDDGTAGAPAPEDRSTLSDDAGGA
jgi:hypothetical protein